MTRKYNKKAVIEYFARRFKITIALTREISRKNKITTNRTERKETLKAWQKIKRNVNELPRSIVKK